jgi:hypothetical protein
MQAFVIFAIVAFFVFALSGEQFLDDAAGGGAPCRRGGRLSGRGPPRQQFLPRCFVARLAETAMREMKRHNFRRIHSGTVLASNFVRRRCYDWTSNSAPRWVKRCENSRTWPRRDSCSGSLLPVNCRRSG